MGMLVSADSSRRTEAECLYQEALDIRRQLAAANSLFYSQDVANTLGALGSAYLNWQEPQKALVCLQESASLLAPLAKQYPSIFGKKQAHTLKLIEQSKK